MNTIFHISLALLKASKKELLQLDFEGALKYFRVVLPRLYRTEANAKELIHKAVKLKVGFVWFIFVRYILKSYLKHFLLCRYFWCMCTDP